MCISYTPTLILLQHVRPIPLPGGRSQVTTVGGNYTHAVCFHRLTRASDRSASPFSAGQPVSFKTNVNRAKTKKWVQAKKNAYDGDDWGDYDEYDEYSTLR